MKINFNKKIASLLFAIIIGASTFLNPFFAPRAQAFLGIGDIVIDVKQFVVSTLGAIAQSIAQKMIDQMVQDTVNWAQSGFEGNPAFVSNPKQELANASNEAAGNYINTLAQGNLCAPFRPQIILGLQQSYTGRLESTQCTFTGAAGNLEDFYDDFSKGGWQGWFSMTQNDSNNPYGAYISAQSGLDSAVSQKVSIQEKQFDWSQGFKSPVDCLAYNPDQDTLNAAHKYFDSGNKMEKGKDDGTVMYKGKEISFFKNANECIVTGESKTPGALIKSQLDNTFASPISKLISVQQINQLISAFATGMLNRYVFGGQGLLSRGGGNQAALKDSVDLDKDGVPDGYDFDGDGIPDACLHGLVNSSELPSKTNCIKSSEVTSSPFFSPICQQTSDSLSSLKSFNSYISSNTFNKNLSQTWLNKISFAQGAVEDLTNLITKLEINNRDYDKTLGTLGSYGKYLDKEVKSLAKDEDLAEGSHIIGSYRNDDQIRQILVFKTTQVITYLEKFQNIVSQKCDNPDSEAINQIETPIIGDPTEADLGIPQNGGTGTGTNSGTGTGTNNGGTNTGSNAGGGTNTSSTNSTNTNTAAPNITGFSVTSVGGSTNLVPGSSMLIDLEGTNLAAWGQTLGCSVKDDSGNSYSSTDSTGNHYINGWYTAPNREGSVTLTAACQNSTGQSSRTASVFLNSKLSYTANDMHVSLAATPSSVQSGQSVTLSWSSNLDYCKFGTNQEYPASGSLSPFVETDAWGNVMTGGHTVTHSVTCYIRGGESSYLNRVAETTVTVQ